LHNLLPHRATAECNQEAPWQESNNKQAVPNSAHQEKGAISMLTKDQLRQRLVEDGICTSTGSLKYEEAAVRTLLAGDVTHYLISAWATGKLEEAMYNGSTALADLGLQALSELKFMLRMAEAMHQRTCCFAYDFKNFNAQHSRRDMKRYYYNRDLQWMPETPQEKLVTQLNRYGRQRQPLLTLSAQGSYIHYRRSMTLVVSMTIGR
jgi:hypothetical protein